MLTSEVFWHIKYVWLDLTCRRPSRCCTVSSLSPPERCTVTGSLGGHRLCKGNTSWIMGLNCKQSSLTKSHLGRGWMYDVDNYLTCIRKAATPPCRPGTARKVQTCYESLNNIHWTKLFPYPFLKPFSDVFYFFVTKIFLGQVAIS